MNYSDEDILRQLGLGEDSHWEFKQIDFSGDRPRSPSRNDLADEIAAFANANGGVILCGVKDDGDVQGMTYRQIAQLDALLVEVSSDSIKPPVRIRTSHRRLAEGKRLLLVEIPEGESQHDSPGGSYLRVGGAKRKMSSDERLRLAQRRGQARFRSFDEQTVPGTGFRTLEERFWRPLLSVEGAANPAVALERLALLAPDEVGILRATVAGVLLCTRNPERWLPGACIMATRYQGRDRSSGQLDAQVITGPLDRQVADATDFARKNMRVAARKDPARVNLPQYSDRALFEALVNAVVHRDYSMHGSRIRLAMFDERLEIQSPGSLPNNLTLKSLGTRQATRNEVLASLLGRLPVGTIRGSHDRMYFMERRGDGVPIILRETRELCGQLPEYQLINGSELCLSIPAESQELSPANAVVTVRSGGQPLQGAELLMLFPNKTWKRATTDQEGEACVELYSTHLSMTVFVAAQGHAAGIVRDWIPSQGALSVALEALDGGGAAIFPEATGYLPGLKGRLNPIRDTHDRTYLYASNLAVNEGHPQPVHFMFGEDLRLTDADGTELIIRIVDIVGRSALVEYHPPPVSEAVLAGILDLQSKKGHLPYWSALGGREEDKEAAELDATRCWAKEMNKRGWRIHLDTIRPNRGRVSKKSTRSVKLDPPDCLAEIDEDKTIGVEVSMLVHPQAKHYWKLRPSEREIPWIGEPGPHVLDQWRGKPMPPDTYAWTLEMVQQALGDIVKNKSEKIENKREKAPGVLSGLSKLFLVIPMDEAWLAGTLGKNEYWTVEGQIIEVPRPRNIDGVYVMGCPVSGEDENGHCPVSEVRLTE